MRVCLSKLTVALQSQHNKALNLTRQFVLALDVSIPHTRLYVGYFGSSRPGVKFPWPTRPKIPYLRRLLDAGLGKRLMFGSDATPSRPQLIPETVEAIESVSFLTDEQKRDIFYNNAARFLRLDD